MKTTALPKPFAESKMNVHPLLNRANLFEAGLFSWGIPEQTARELTAHHTESCYESGKLIFSQGSPADIVLCCQVGLWLKALFDALKMESFAKTSGSKGLQVYVPINGPATYDKTKAFSHAIAELLESQSPDAVVSNMQKSRRSGKVLVDWSQNDDHKTTVNVYSLRAKEYPSVSTPVTWEEVETVVRTKDATSLQFVSKEVLKRVEKAGDLFAPVLSLKQKLPSLRVIQNLRSQ